MDTYGNFGQNYLRELTEVMHKGMFPRPSEDSKARNFLSPLIIDYMQIWKISRPSIIIAIRSRGLLRLMLSLYNWNTTGDLLDYG